MQELPHHLGGHGGITHLDRGVLDYMIAKYKIKSFLDIGCGPGGMVNLANQKGLQSYGIDGDFTVKRPNLNFQIIDYSKTKSLLNQKYDFVWSCEFVEHVDEQYIPNYMPDFALGKYVAMTYNQSKRGHHHVTLKPKDFWIELFKTYDLIFDTKETEKIREVSTMNTTGKFLHKQFVKKNGLFFKNTQV